MIVKMYAVYDKKGDFFAPPFYGVTDAHAIRQFSDWVNDRNTPYGRHPEDYTMAVIGSFDDQTGVVLGLETGPKWLIQGKEAITLYETK